MERDNPYYINMPRGMGATPSLSIYSTSISAKQTPDHRGRAIRDVPTIELGMTVEGFKMTPEERGTLTSRSGEALNEHEFDEAIRLCIKIQEMLPEDDSRTIHAQQRELIARSMKGESDLTRRFDGLLERAATTGNEVTVGDGFRDYALHIIRHNPDNETAINNAEAYLWQAQELHADDKNRLACLDGAFGRIEYTRGNYEGALALHESANDTWLSLGKDADEQWIFNNRLPHLRALASLISQSDDPQDLIEKSRSLTLTILSDKAKCREKHIREIERLWSELIRRPVPLPPPDISYEA